MGTRRGFGYLRRLPSKRYQASYVGPDLQRHTAPHTFEAKIDAEEWLAAERRLLVADDWLPPGQRKRQGVTFGAYAEQWLRGRELKPRTIDLYRRILDRSILPTFEDRMLSKITAADVRAWHASLDPRKKTARAHAYALMRTIMATAATEELIPSNPCTIRGAGQTKRERRIEPATLAELEALVRATPERLRLMPLLAAWCGLRFGELAELRRHDVDTTAGVLRVSRALVRVDRADVVGKPKSAAGVRTVAIPPHLVPVVVEHLATHTAPGRESLLFPHDPANPRRHFTHGWYYKDVHMPARVAAGRPDLRFHDLRHTGAVLAAQTGATLAELMARLGHSTPGAAMRYQHAASGRDAEIAAALSKMAGQDTPRDTPGQ
jgi:integrase